MSAAQTQQQPTTATLDRNPRVIVGNDTVTRAGEQIPEVDPCDNAVPGTLLHQCWRTIAKLAPKALRVHASPHDDLAWTAAAFHPM